MKFLSLPSFDIVKSALNFDTPDCHVTGSCDLYTTKAAGSDKKLYKNITQSLEAQAQAQQQNNGQGTRAGSASSPPQHPQPRRDSSTLSVSSTSRRLSSSATDSAFGSLEDVSSRRVFAYLIATLNASHPDYDFSQVLRPADFKRERVLRRVMAHIDSTLSSVRPQKGDDAETAALRASSYTSPTQLILDGRGGGGGDGINPAPYWGPQMWALIDKQMALEECAVYSYAPEEGAFDEEEGAIWALHYFFFNKALKRVCYLYVRGVPVMSSHSPRRALHHGLLGGVSYRRRKTSGIYGSWAEDIEEEVWESKRARYWFGERIAERMGESDEEMDDGLVWNRDKDGEVCWGCDDDEDEEEGEDETWDEEMEDDYEEEEEEEQGENTPVGRSRSPLRGVTEHAASSMEIDVA